MLTEATVVTRADDQVNTVMTLWGTLADGSAYRNPVTMVYNVREGQIVRVIGIYDEASLAPFAEAFAEAAKNSDVPFGTRPAAEGTSRSEEHTSELQSLMRISYAVFCLKQNTQQTN